MIHREKWLHDLYHHPKHALREREEAEYQHGLRMHALFLSDINVVE